MDVTSSVTNVSRPNDSIVANKANFVEAIEEVVRSSELTFGELEAPHLNSLYKLSLSFDMINLY